MRFSSFIIRDYHKDHNPHTVTKSLLARFLEKLCCEMPSVSLNGQESRIWALHTNLQAKVPWLNLQRTKSYLYQWLRNASAILWRLSVLQRTASWMTLRVWVPSPDTQSFWDCRWFHVLLKDNTNHAGVCNPYRVSCSGERVIPCLAMAPSSFSQR